MRRLSLIIAIFLTLGAAVYGQSPHGSKLKEDCSVCHNPESWQVTPSQVKFDHSTTAFKLMGQHKSVNCTSCHVSLKFEDARTECSSCHTTPHGTSVSNECASCHTTDNWLVKDIQGIHDRGRFPLIGKHKTADCSSCHTTYQNLNFTVQGVDCYSCHAGDYASANNPNHIASGFSKDCTSCHTIEGGGWGAGNFNHTFFPLLGGHALPQCSSCHTSGSFTGLSPVCYTCHKPDFDATANPPHSSAGFSTECQTCHTINGWKPANFDHAITGFQLTGKHTQASCNSCHKQGYANTPSDCYSCHQANYQATQNPNHTAAGFSTDCAPCHSTNGWQPATFDHEPKFPIATGSHRGKWNACSDCHTNPVSYADFSCTNCHEHNKTDMDREHQGVSGYIYQSRECFACHPRGEAEGAFNHQTSIFPLTGSHLTLDCASCHVTTYANTPSDCYTCHTQGYQTQTRLSHQDAGFGTNCTECHNTTNWAQTTFNHESTGFFLGGRHVGPLCKDCHTTGAYTTTVQECKSCHTDSYNNAAEPNHLAANISMLCQDCHTVNGWKPSTFNHATTGFTLTGKHVTATCQDCHAELGYQITGDCKQCHLDSYNTSVNPPHSQAGLSQQCQDCHSTNGWSPSSYDHSVTGFTLTGAHVSKTCNDCHQTQGYTNVSQECKTCHLDEFNVTTNPPHRGAGFPVDCQECHTTTAWTPANWDHDGLYFPIFSGKHNNKWNLCSDCHDNSANFAQFTCISCHEHNRQEMDNEHQGVQGYVYVSSECYACHPDGSKEGGFNHSTSQFPLTGAHLTVNCSECHTGGYTNTSAECRSCHTDSYNSAQNPNHVAAGLPLDCSTCHNSTAYVPSTFNHSSTGFTLAGSHINQQCSACHQGTVQGQSQECQTCHTDEYNASINPNHASLNLSLNCGTCHQSGPGWEPALFPLATHNQYYQLQGAHVQIASNCGDCHNGNYNTTPNTCYGCHQPEYQSATNPPHTVSPQFTTTCTTCHSQTAWTNATFNHSFYPVGNRHANLDCNECHTTTNYNPQCISCHLDDFLEEHNPNTSRLCFDCHNTSNWDGDAPPANRKMEKM